MKTVTITARDVQPRRHALPRERGDVAKVVRTATDGRTVTIVVERGSESTSMTVKPSTRLVLLDTYAKAER